MLYKSFAFTGYVQRTNVELRMDRAEDSWPTLSQNCSTCLVFDVAPPHAAGIKTSVR